MYTSCVYICVWEGGGCGGGGGRYCYVGVKARDRCMGVRVYLNSCIFNLCLK